MFMMYVQLPSRTSLYPMRFAGVVAVASRMTSRGNDEHYVYQELSMDTRKRNRSKNGHAPRRQVAKAKPSAASEAPCDEANRDVHKAKARVGKTGQKQRAPKRPLVQQNVNESFTLSPINPVESHRPRSRVSRVSVRECQSAAGSLSSRGKAHGAREKGGKGSVSLFASMGDFTDDDEALGSARRDEEGTSHGESSSDVETSPEGDSTSRSLDAKCKDLCSWGTICDHVLAEECACGNDCTGHMTRCDVAHCREATVVASRSRLLQDHTRATLVRVMHEDRKTNTKHFDYVFNNTRICNEAFRLLHGFTPTGMRNALTWCKADDERRKEIDNPRQVEVSAILQADCEEAKGLGFTERNLTCEDWIRDYVAMHGCKMPDSEQIHIDNVPWNEIHEDYYQDTKGTCFPLKLSRFRSVWDTNFRHVRKRRRKPFGECAECAGFKDQLQKLRKDPQQRDVVMKRYKGHLDHQKEERLAYYKRRKKGKWGSAISIIMDGMDQSKTDLPHTQTALKSDGDMVETKITGVLVHGRSFQCYVSEPQVKHDTNLSLTCLHDTLMKELNSDEPEVDTLYLQVDGGSENKNQWVIAYFVILISLGIFSKIKMCFLPVGHTHEDIDQGFSCIARYLRRVSAFTFEELMDAVRKSFKKESKPPNVFQIGQSFDWKDFVSGGEPMPMSSWTDNHVYRFSWNPYHKQVQMHYKKFCQSEGYFGAHQDTFVKSFKAVERQALVEKGTWEKQSGILLGTGEPYGVPKHAANIDFTAPKPTTSGKEG